MRIGLDIGSTTIKAVVLDDAGNVIFTSYQRHSSQIIKKATELLLNIDQEVLKGQPANLAISGSAGMGLAESCGVTFVQEVYATRVSAKRLQPDVDVIIELGGEDAKILFLKGEMEVRMNGSCAGGTGAFIDQMATLLDVSPMELNELANQHEKIYTIASRCGVFAKSDIQPLLNQGARKNDVAASIFYSVVNQTIAGLAQGRSIIGNVVYLGGPLTFLSGLRDAFDKVLKLEGNCPENSLYYVALGAAFSADTEVNMSSLIEKLKEHKGETSFDFIEPLFTSQEEYDEFAKRHAQASVPNGVAEDFSKGVYIGIDAGSTTLKTVVMGADQKLLCSKYQSNSGNPVPLIREFLEELYQNYPNINILSSAVTGYGEDIIKNAFFIDYGIVETVAHFSAAKKFMPNVDFIIDIGGQDIKCFKIHNGTVDNIYLNEACSSGCGSFLQTFAGALGYSIEEFAQKGLFAPTPVDLGSRCTVFMNSSVKQAQKDGASTENISAGLSISVVKNALYKVIRPSSTQDLGSNIVVQGGTFYNDAVLRAFEKELGLNVVRPDIAGLMGAYGAALYAQSQHKAKPERSNIILKRELKDFIHSVSVANCGLCQNNCRLTVNTFSKGKKYISGNRCERPITNKKVDESLDLYSYKLKLLQSYYPIAGERGTIGIPFGLNMYELLPFWHTFFSQLGFKVIVSPLSNRKLYLLGQSTIPSDTVCFPAKLMHGHVQSLIDSGIKTIFYPCMSYNIDESISDNCYNCPVVAYYPEVLDANMPDAKNVMLIKDYIGLHRKKDVVNKLYEMMKKYFSDVTKGEIRTAAKAAYKEYERYMQKVCDEGDAIIQRAEEANAPIVVLAGRPYHIDPEINHGINSLITNFGAAIITEEVLSRRVKEKVEVDVLNQWTYHSRLYASAKYITQKDNMDFVQLVSFGCGCDAITTDECREILEDAGKIYTQIKIDEITNLGAVKIRLRSLFAATAISKEPKL